MKVKRALAEREIRGKLYVCVDGDTVDQGERITVRDCGRDRPGVVVLDGQFPIVEITSNGR